MEFIRNSIINSELPKLFDLTNIDWNACRKYASSALAAEAWELWDRGMTSTVDIGKTLNVSYNTAAMYLKAGAEAGLCSYSRQEALSAAAKKGSMKRNRPVVQLSLDGKYLAKYDSILDAISALQLSNSANPNITAACRGKKKSAYKYKWMYLEDWKALNGLNKEV